VQVQLSEAYHKDVHRAIEILKEAGCTHVFLFGSLTAEKMRDRSDIDLAIRGCPKGKFFHLLGRLLLELDHPVDLVNLDGIGSPQKSGRKELNKLKGGVSPPVFSAQRVHYPWIWDAGDTPALSPY